MLRLKIRYLEKGIKLERNLESSEFYNLMVFIFFTISKREKSSHNI